jgi:hypothetical protein
MGTEHRGGTWTGHPATSHGTDAANNVPSLPVSVWIIGGQGQVSSR